MRILSPRLRRFLRHNHVMPVTKYTRAWASAHLALVNPKYDVLAKTIKWAMEDPRYIEQQEDGMAHCQWTIQLRFDPLSDEDKKEYMNKLVVRVASHLLAQANLLEGPIQSTIACYSDDFMKARKEIALVPDTIGEALKAYAVEEQEGLSDEMQEVVSGLNTRKRK